jgi:hypothetical protein
MTRILAAVVALAGGVQAQGAWRMQAVPLDTNAWHVLRAAIGVSGGGVSFSQDGTDNGFLLPLGAKPRQASLVEADLRVGRRLAASGWSFAGVTLYEDEGNFWMLALVEGPDGRRTVDFIESHGRVWQAQNEPRTALKREGNVSFDWQKERTYRLRLTLEGGRVSARITDPADGRELGAASYALGGAPAVRAGRPGLVARGSAAVCLRLSCGQAEPPSGGPAVPSVALLDDALPGHDRSANARLAAALEARGLAVARVTADRLLEPGALTADAYPVLVLPQCEALPARLCAEAQRFAREGGHLVFLGGPFLDRALWKVGGRWLDRDGLQARVQDARPRHRPFEIGPALETQAWRRSCADSGRTATFGVAGEGPGGSPCLKLDIRDFQGWEVRQSPELPALFGAGDTFFTFLGKGGKGTGQLAVEIIERDGSRWIATAPLTPEWRRVGLRLEDFLYWKDSAGAKGRGHAGDRLNPKQAARVCFGLSNSHTSSVGPGAHTVWLAEIGTGPDPLAEAGVASAEMTGSIEGVYPRYKVYQLPGPADVSSRRLDALVERPLEREQTGLVCAIPRTLGEGFGRQARWRFVPFAGRSGPWASDGVCEWLLLNTRFPLDGTAVAGFGYTSPAVWSAPGAAARIADMAALLAGGTVLEEAGTEQFAYWPGETVRVGARVRCFGAGGAEAAVTLVVRRGQEEVFRQTVRRSFDGGASDVAFTWQPPAAPGAYSAWVSLAAPSGTDVIEHGFSVLDPAPAPKAAFITARDGDFWLQGKKWYPVGVNFWPLYVGGMDREDYGAGWLKNAYYSPALVERDLAHLRDLGINLVSIQTPPLEHHRNLLDFLARCQRFGIYANLYVGQASPLAFDDRGLSAFIQAARLAGNATVFAYDTIWEPGNHVFKDDAARAKWDGEWRAWIEERYGSVEQAEKDWGYKARRDREGRVVSPPDACFREDGAWRVMMAAYRRFMDNLTSRLWGRANRRLRELDPNHLVSFRQGNTLPYDFALSGPVKHIDFICPEGYSIRDTDEGEAAIGFITRYVDFTTRGKPIVWSEFGQSVWDNGRMEPDAGAVARQGSYSERFYRTALAAGANGTAPWWWVGGYRVDERSDFGLIAPDRTERPAARLIREYGPRLSAAREKPRPAAWFDFDRDAHAGGYWRAAFHEGAAAYAAAAREGKTLGVRSAGTGCDSASAPRVALGNVELTGSNPPKHLDAEFNVLQVQGADGVWREAEDGAVIAVAAGRPVRARASLGNLQEATWRAAGEGAVAVVAREGGAVVSRRPLAQDTPYLADAELGEWALLPEARGSRTLSVRLEADGLAPFGEARVFTLRAAAAPGGQ